MKLVKVQNEVKVISKLTVAQVKRLKALNKNVMYDDKGKVIFGVDFSTTGNINNNSITFNEPAENNCAMLTMVYAPDDSEATDLLKSFAETYIKAIDNLSAFEQTAEEILNNVDSRINEIVDNAETIHING